LKLEPKVVFSDGPPVYRWIGKRSLQYLFEVACL